MKRIKNASNLAKSDKQHDEVTIERILLESSESGTIIRIDTIPTSDITNEGVVIIDVLINGEIIPACRSEFSKEKTPIFDTQSTGLTRHDFSESDTISIQLSTINNPDCSGVMVEMFHTKEGEYKSVAYQNSIQFLINHPTNRELINGARQLKGGHLNS